MRVEWLRTALANLVEEAGFIARDNPAAARRIARAIGDSVERLSRYPALGKPGRVNGTRELVVPGTPYIVPYRVRADRVEILRVFHGRRKWPSQL